MGHPKIKKHFSGVYPCNHLPTKKISKYPQFFVINSCTVPRQNNKKKKNIVIESFDKDWKLCHWQSAAVFNSKVIFFDSSGLPPENKYIIRFLSKQKKLVEISTAAIQAQGSNLCGLFSLEFLHFISNGLSLNQYLSQFEKHPQRLEKNDEIVIKMFKLAFK